MLQNNGSEIFFFAKISFLQLFGSTEKNCERKLDTLVMVVVVRVLVGMVVTMDQPP